MNKSILDSNIYNSVNPSSIEPKSNKLRPFPLENFDEDVGAAYKHVDVIGAKLNAAKINPVNKTKEKQKLLNNLIYKASLCRKMLQEINKQAFDFWS